MITLENLTKSFADTTALQGIDLHIEAGRTSVLIGPSGCGKSTVLRLINGLLLPEAGRVSFLGEALDYPDCLHTRQKMGYVIQEGGLFPHMTVRRNISLMAELGGWSATAITERLHELCQLTRLPQELLTRYPAQLSGGQRQRVALMRALLTDPPVLLLDEPLGALDPMIRRELQLELKQIFSSLGKTVVLVTHDLAEANYFADRIILMEQGRVVQQGTLSELAKNPASPFVTAFIQAQSQLVLPVEAKNHQ